VYTIHYYKVSQYNQLHGMSPASASLLIINIVNGIISERRGAEETGYSKRGAVSVYKLFEVVMQIASQTILLQIVRNMLSSSAVIPHENVSML